MARSRAELIDWVQSRIDEVGVVDQPSTVDPSIISFEIDEAANNLLRSAERNVIYPLSSIHAATFCLVKKIDTVPVSVIIPIEKELVRPLRIQLYEWKNISDMLVSVKSAKYKKQANPPERATVNKPLAALIPFLFSYVDGAVTKSYNQAIECFPAPPTVNNTIFRIDPAFGNTTEANIVAAATAQELVTIFEGGLGAGQHAEIKQCIVVKRKVAEDLPENLHSPMVWMCAAQLLTSMREKGAADQCNQYAGNDLSQLAAGIAGEL
jgi:hypothetical protein